jgi:hypothetical protein
MPKKFHRHGRRRDERDASQRLWDVLDVLERYTAVDDKFDSSDVAALRAVVSPDPTSAADHRKLYRVLEVWSVDKR